MSGPRCEGCGGPVPKLSAEDRREFQVLTRQDRETAFAFHRQKMKEWTRRLPWLMGIMAVGGLFSFGIGIVYVANAKEPCARCLDNAHAAWGCEGNEYLEDCIESRRHELDRCLTLCPTGTNS